MRSLASGVMLTLVLSVGCSPNEPIDPTPTVEHAMTAQELGRLGAEIRNSPDRADALLSEHGMTAEQLETEVRRVAADPEESRAYRQSFEATIADQSQSES